MPKVRTRANQPKWKRNLGKGLRILKWTLLVAVLAVGAFDLYRFLFTSDFFMIREVEVQGCVRTSPDPFIALADVPPQTNIFLFRTRALADRLRRHPWVDQARVVRILPDKVRIVLEEREPLAAINSPLDGQVYGVDRHLVLLPEPGPAVPGSATSSSCFDLPIITGLPPGHIYPGNRLSDPGAFKVMETLLLLLTLKTDLLKELSEIHIDSNENLTLYPIRRVQAIYLGNENLQRRAWRLCRVWDYLQVHDLESRYIDCRFDAQGVLTHPENLTLAKWNALPQADRNLIIAGAQPAVPEESRP